LDAVRIAINALKEKRQKAGAFESFAGPGVQELALAPHGRCAHAFHAFHHLGLQHLHHAGVALEA
jgi:hypothetical protein